MKTKHSIKKAQTIFFVLMLFFLLHEKSYCQSKQNPGQKPQEKSHTLTPGQTATIKTILSKYKATALTATDAKAIHEKFREAGLHDGPETRDAIIAAGFDPEKLRTLDPPKNPDNSGKPKPPTSEERMKTIQEKVIGPLSLNPTQKEVITKAFKDFFADMENLMKSQPNPQVPLEKSKIEPLEKARDEKIRQVLSKDQFLKYQDLEKASRPPRINDPGPGKN